MKKKVGSGPPAKMNEIASPKTVDDYLAGVGEPALSMLVKMRAAIRSALPPEATETISYRMPAFKHKQVLVWIGAFKSHCSLFPTARVIESFSDELKGFTISKGSVHFPLDKPLPIALIKKIVKVRLEQSGKKK